MQRLWERDALLEMAERSAGLGIWDIDLATETLRATPQFWRIMGLPQTDRPVSIEITRQLRLLDDRERVAQGFRNVLGNHAEQFEMEYRIRRPDGEIRWIFGRGRLIRDAAGRAVRYSGIDIDVTERKAGEAALADLNRALEKRIGERSEALEREIARRAEAEAQLQHAQKMETIGQLTGGIAHDFNNLLTVIAGNIEALERNLPEGDHRLRRFAEAALRGTERAAVLTSRLLLFARRQPLAPELIDVNRLLAGMSDLLRRTLGENIALDLRLADGIECVLADPHQFEHAVLNLAINARDAMPSGGVLTVATSSAMLTDPEAAGEWASPAGRCVAVAIGDTGFGMTAEVREKAFDAFFTTKSAGHGTGLGLAQVHSFVKQCGGLCQLDSAPGAGTTVRLYLPASTASALPAQNETLTSLLPRGRGEAILVTEDDAEMRAYCVELLRELGYEVVAASEAADALHLLETNRQIQLLFADVGLPGPLDGRRLAETALARFPGLQILLTSGYADQPLTTNGLQGPVELIAKPFTSAALAAKIRQTLDRVAQP